MLTKLREDTYINFDILMKNAIAISIDPETEDVLILCIDHTTINIRKDVKEIFFKKLDHYLGL